MWENSFDKEERIWNNNPSFVWRSRKKIKEDFGLSSVERSFNKYEGSFSFCCNIISRNLGDSFSTYCLLLDEQLLHIWCIIYVCTSDATLHLISLYAVQCVFCRMEIIYLLRSFVTAKYYRGLHPIICIYSLHWVLRPWIKRPRWL